MSMKERPLGSVDEILRGMEEGLGRNLPPYTNMESKDWVRVLQKAAFGDQAVEVTGEQYQELIHLVRVIRPKVKKIGKTAEDHPAFKNTGHQIHWLSDITEGEVFCITIEPRPFEQSAGHGREPYPKFNVFYEDDNRSTDFTLNFDDTYTLYIRWKASGVYFDADGLKRKHMTSNEFLIAKNTIARVCPHFGINLAGS